MSSGPLFATCTYQEFDPSYGIPVRATVGYPRFKLRYQLSANMPDVAPGKWFNSVSDEKFIEMYFAKLDSVGVAAVRSEAEAIREAAHRITDPVVLLCFDKLWLHPEELCHRRLFAQWWEDHTGEEVPEFGRTVNHPAKSIPIPDGLW